MTMVSIIGGGAAHAVGGGLRLVMQRYPTAFQMSRICPAQAGQSGECPLGGGRKRLRKVAARTWASPKPPSHLQTCLFIGQSMKIGYWQVESVTYKQILYVNTASSDCPASTRKRPSPTLGLYSVISVGY